jgi:hypothetical protein
MAQLRFQRGRGRIAVIAGSGELLTSCVDDDALDEREAALRGMDALLDGVTVSRHNPEGETVPAEVVLYNPYTYETAFRALPDTVVYGDGSPLLLPSDGQLGVLREDGVSVGARNLPLRSPQWVSVLRAHDAHLG